MGYVGESSIMIVVIEPQRGGLPLVARPVHAINKEDVLPAVAIVVEKGAARSKGFRKKLASVGAAVVLEMNAGRICNVHEAEAGIECFRSAPGEHGRSEADAAPARPRRKRSTVHWIFTKPLRMA